MKDTMVKLDDDHKLTDIGLIPKDWEVGLLESQTILKARIGWQGLTTSEYQKSGKYYLITGTEFKNGKIEWDDCYFVTKHRYCQDKNIQIRKGDVLITKDGSIGKVAYIDTGLRQATLNSGVFVARPINNQYDNRLFYYLLMSDIFLTFLAKLSAGSTINHLYQKDFVNFKFPLPNNKSEQTAIANVLSETDELIEKLDELIEKKKSIKIGVMQKLLTGRKRLPGFTGEWGERSLGELIRIQGGYSFLSTKFKSYGIPVIRISNIVEERISLRDTIFYHEFEIPKEYKIFKWDLLIAMSGATTGKTGVYLSDKTGYLNQRVGKFVIKDKNILSNKYLSYFIKSDKFTKGIQKELAAGAQPNISGKQIENIELSIPLNKPEQTAIANILSEMDSEIEKLENKLEKYRKIKAGMMQQLLTGKIRLV